MYMSNKGIRTKKTKNCVTSLSFKSQVIGHYRQRVSMINSIPDLLRTSINIVKSHSQYKCFIDLVETLYAHEYLTLLFNVLLGPILWHIALNNILITLYLFLTNTIEK